MKYPDLKINYERLKTKIDVLATIGTTPEGGVKRLALSDADKQGRDLVVEWMRDLHLNVKIDQIGNIFAIGESQQDK